MAENAGLIISVILLIVFLVVAMLLARLNILRHTGKLIETSPIVNFPFPQALDLPQGTLGPATVSREGMQAVIRRAYQEWQERYILAEKDPRRAFLRTGTGKRFLKYEYLSTSFGQGLALINAVLMAGEDQKGQVLFDRLLFSTIIRPSFDHEDLTSWQMVPDGRSARLNADLHAEAWIAFATLAAFAQWKDSVRVDYKVIAQAHLKALSTVMGGEAQNLEEVVYALYFIKAFGKNQSKHNWNDVVRKLDAATTKLIISSDAELVGDAANEDASLALQVLNLGLERLLGGEGWDMRTQVALERVVRQAYAHLQDGLGEESIAQDYPKGFSRLALLSCCAPAAATLGDRELVSNYWALLEDNLPGRNDPIGASLRLLAMQALAGNMWFGKVDWAGLLV
jgi:hypothetical protein